MENKNVRKAIKYFGEAIDYISLIAQYSAEIYPEKAAEYFKEIIKCYMINGRFEEVVKYCKDKLEHFKSSDDVEVIEEYLGRVTKLLKT